MKDVICDSGACFLIDNVCQLCGHVYLKNTYGNAQKTYKKKISNCNRWKRFSNEELMLIRSCIRAKAYETSDNNDLQSLKDLYNQTYGVSALNLDISIF